MKITLAQLNYIIGDFEGNTLKQTTTYIGPSIRYMVPIIENVYLPLVASAGYTSFNIDPHFKAAGIAYKVGAGVEYLFANKFGINVMLNYDFGTVNDEPTPGFRTEFDTTKTRVNTGFNLYFSR